MDEVVSVDPIAGRFEKVLRFYWDGIPVPPFVAGEVDMPRKTFLFRLLGYAPDYYGEVAPLELTNPVVVADLFVPLAESEQVTSSMSSRIGSHYSPTVGLFRFRDARSKSTQGPNQEQHQINDIVKRVRIPTVPCEDVTSVFPDSTPEYRQRVRMQGLIDLYEPLVKEFSRMSPDSLKRIVVLATHSLGKDSKHWVVREICVVNDEYTKWLSEAIFFYMCVNPVFRNIIGPLQVMDKPVPRLFSIITLNKQDRAISQRHFREGLRGLQESFFWNKKTRGFFEAIRVCWERNFKNLALFDLSMTERVTRAGPFLEQILNSMRAAFAKIRIEFYSNMEDFFFSYVVGAKEILTMNEDDMRKSRFQNIFLATRMFQMDQLRELLFENLKRLVEFFDCNGKRGRRLTPKVAFKHPLLQLELVVGDKYQPRSPAFSHFRFGISDLFVELLKSVNGFPLPECAILRTLELADTPLVVVDDIELAEYRASVMEVLDEVAGTIDDLAHRYSRFADLPPHNVQTARSSSFSKVQEHTHYLRDRKCEVATVSPDTVFSGCFAITCISVKQQYASNWAKCLERFYKEYHMFVAEMIKAADEKCATAMVAIQRTPKTVEQLEEYLGAVKAAESLAEKVRKLECEEVIAKFNWMEEIQIPIDGTAYSAALELMKWPARLRETAALADSVRDKCRPFLLAELNRLRNDTRANIRTLATGVTELYNMFNLEICDIAAQTCSELRELVDHIEATVETIRNQEFTLGQSAIDVFDDLPPLINYFDTIEQFWLAVYRASGLREFYTTPVATLNAEKAIEDVREWRRLIHTSRRGLRAFPPLVRLGHQQELALARFEALEDLLHLLTTPGLRKGHWKEISRLVAAKLADDVTQVGDMTISLQKILDSGIASFISDLRRIALQARTDYEVESKLEEMKSMAKRTYFQISPAVGEVVPRLVIAPECHRNLQAYIEQFVHQSRNLRRNPGLSPLVLKAVSEWEVSSERTHDLLLRWEKIDAQWGNLYSFFLALEKADVERHKLGSASLHQQQHHQRHTQQQSDTKLMLDKLSRAADAFHVVYSTLSKPQYSLYMAIVQESLADNLNVAKHAMSDVIVALADTFERMRAAFPRFNFVTDSQLLTFLTAYNTANFVRLLPCMYPKVCSVTVFDNCITAFTTTDGATLRATTRLPLSDEPTGEWMRHFDQCLTSSLYDAICACATEYGQVDVDVWTGNWCTQLLVMALRITHTREMRDAMQFAGYVGLRAYKTRVDCVVEEISRLASVAAMDPESEVRVRLASVVVYMRHAAMEVEFALANNVSSCADLDATTMFQTFITDTTIVVRFTGIDLAYGFEFLGDYQLFLMSPHLVGNVVSMLAFNGGRGGVPILSGGVEKDHVLEVSAQLLGSFLMRMQCCEMCSLPALRLHLRGAIELGALLCVQECEHISATVQPTLVACVSQVGETLRQQRSSSTTATLPLAVDGVPLSMTINPRFLAVFTTENVEAVPRSLVLDFRFMSFPQAASNTLVRSFMLAYGLNDDDSGCSTAFGALYEQFHEANTAIFSDAALQAVMRGVTLDPLPPVSTSADGGSMDRLLMAFLSVFSPRIREDERLRQLLRWNITHTISAFSISPECQAMLDLLAIPVEDLKPDELFGCFADMMATCNNAVLVGPGFSGKTKLWKRWVAQTRHTIFSPSLMTTEDFYGTEDRPGFLASLGREMTKSSEPCFIIVEDGNLSTNSLWATWPQFSRVPGPEACFITNPQTHVLVSTRTLCDTTPKLASDFGIFYLPPSRDWRKFLKSCVRGGLVATSRTGPSAANNGAPTNHHNDIAVRVMEALVPHLFVATHPGVTLAAIVCKKEKPGPQAGGGTSAEADAYAEGAYRTLGEEDNNRLFAFSQRCASLYKRWYRHATQQYSEILGKVGEDYVVDDKTFAAQCAVFAVCWSSGLALEEEDQPIIGRVLRDADRALQTLAERYSIVEPLLPAFGEKEDDNVLHYVVTRGGWKTLSQSAAYGIDQTWSNHNRVSAQKHAWTQRFLLPSRLPVLGAVECLLNCGQSVMLSGSQGNGKSTLLQTIPLSDRWVSQLVSTNKSLNPALVQAEMAANLTRRSNGRYGPSLGRKLVVCIDDVHLSRSVETNLPLVGRLISFCDKFSSVSTAKDGLLPTMDVVFLATTLARTYDAIVMRSCVAVHLPSFSGGELVEGLWKLFDASCGRKRVDGFPRECASFLTLAHASFVRLLSNTPTSFLLSNTTDSPLSGGAGRDNDSANGGKGADGSAANSSNNGTPSTRLPSPRTNPLVIDAERTLPWRFSDALRAAEFTRQLLTSTTSDVQVATSLFSAVKTLYTTFMSTSGAESEVTVFQSRLVEAAQKTLGTSVQDVKFSTIAAKDRKPEPKHQLSSQGKDEGDGNTEMVSAVSPKLLHMSSKNRSGSDPAFAVSDADRDTVAEWIAEFEVTIDEATEEELEGKFNHKSNAATTGGRSNSSNSTPAADAAWSDEKGRVPQGGIRATLITYAGAAVPTGYNRPTTPTNRPGSGAVLRGSRRTSFPGGINRQTPSGMTTPRRGSLLRSGGGGHRGSFSSFPTQQQRTVSKTYQTTWLTAVLVRLHRTVHQHDSHAALVGESSFGTHRLLRLFGSATRVPLAVFREVRLSYTFSIVKTELRALIMFAYANDVRVNVYLPFKMLHISGVLRQIDILMRSGEISELFTVEERAALARGYHHTHSGATLLTSVEYVEMRRRVRSSLRFITQVPSSAALEQLAEEYPSFARMISIPLHSPAVDTALLREIAMGILTEEKIQSLPSHRGLAELLRPTAATPPLKLLGDNERLATMLITIYNAVRKKHPSTRPEQLMEFAREVRYLREMQLGPVLFGAQTAATILGRADDATALITRGTEEVKQAVLTLATTRTTLESLKAHLHYEEKQCETWSSAAAVAKSDLETEGAHLLEETAKMLEERQKSDKTLTTASNRLRKVKSTFVRSLAVLRLPEKGVLLVRAVYRLLGEEMPDYSNSPSTLWTLAMRYICSPNFPEKLTALHPEQEREPASLLAMEEELSTVRYANASPYAQLIADYTVAFMANIRIRLRIENIDEPRLARMRDELATSKGLVNDLATKVDEAHAAKAATAAAIVENEEKCVALEKSMEMIVEREKHLLRYVGLVDRFSRFVTKADVAARQKTATCAEGDIVLVSCFFSSLVMETGTGAMCDKVRRILHKQQNLESSASVDEPCKSLLFPGREALLSQFVPAVFPNRHRLALYGLIRRVSCRWQLFGGVCATFEGLLKEYLSLECCGCVIVSALDPTLKEQIVRAMKDGEGVLLRDADSPVALEVMRSLYPLLEKLQNHRDSGSLSAAKALEREVVHSQTPKVGKAGGRPGGGAAADSNSNNNASRFVRSTVQPTAGSEVATSYSSPSTAATKIPFFAFDKDIDVHPKFFLIGTSVGVVSASQMSLAATASANVVNFFTPLPSEARFHSLLYFSSAPKTAAEDARERRERFYRETVAFAHAYDVASELLSQDLYSIVDENPMAQLDKIEGVLAEVDAHDGQLAHAVVQMQSWNRQKRELWEPLESSLRVSTQLLRFLEEKKLHRMWDDRILDCFVATMTTLSPELAARLAPQHFVDLPQLDKYFYAMVNFLDSVIQVFSCGWPAPIRGIFGFYLLSGVVVTGKEIESHRGTHYPTDVELLNKAQFALLQRILHSSPTDLVRAALASCNDDLDVAKSALQLWILEQYRDSGDPVLQDIARELGPTDFALSAYQPIAGEKGAASPRDSDTSRVFCASSGSYMTYFFRSLADLDLAHCEAAALQLCGTFFAAVKDANAIAKKELGHDSNSSNSTVTGGKWGAGELSVQSHGSVPPLRGGGGGGGGGRLDAGSSVTALRGTALSTTSRMFLSTVQPHGVGGGSVDGSPKLGETQHQRVAPQLTPNENVEHHEVHSLSALLQCATHNGLPICFPATMPTRALKTLRQEAFMMKWAFQSHEVASVGALEAAQGEILRCFHRRPPDGLGHCVAVHVSVDERAMDDDGGTRALVGQVHRLLTTYRGYRGSLTAVLSGGCVPVCLFVVCHPRTHGLLWSGVEKSTELERNRCLYVNRDFFTPQDHLLAILRNGTIQSGLGTFMTNRRAAHSIAKHATTAGRSQHFQADSPTAAASAAGAAETGPASSASSSAKNPNALTPLEVAATLIAKELAVVHVGLTARQALLLRLWESSLEVEDQEEEEGDSNDDRGDMANSSNCVCDRKRSTRRTDAPVLTYPPLFSAHFNDNDDSLNVLLQLLHAWVQRQLRVVDATAAAEGVGTGSVTGAIPLYKAGLPPGTIHASLAGLLDRKPTNSNGSVLRGGGGANLSVGSSISTLRMPSTLSFGKDGGSQCVNGDSMVLQHSQSPAFTNSSGGASANMSLGMQAYLFYRNQRPMWRLHLDPVEMGIRGLDEAALGLVDAAVPGTSTLGSAVSAAAATGAAAAAVPRRKVTTLTSLQRNLPGLALKDSAGEDTRMATSINSSGTTYPTTAAAVSAMAGSLDDTRARTLCQLQHIIYSVFQKFAMAIYMGGSHSEEDRLAVQRMLATILVPPHNTTATGGSGAATGTAAGNNNGGVVDLGDQGTVDCNLTGTDPYCFLMLDTNPDFQLFASEVRTVGSDLTELMGDCDAYHRYCLANQKELMRCLFLSSPVLADDRDAAAVARGADAPRSPTPLPTSSESWASSATSRFDESVCNVLSEPSTAPTPLRPHHRGVHSSHDRDEDGEEDADGADRDGSDSRHLPFGKVEDEYGAGGDAAADSHPAPLGSTAALVWSFEEAPLRRLYDVVFNPASASTAVAAAVGLKGSVMRRSVRQQRHLVLDTARSIASALWQYPFLVATGPPRPVLSLWVSALSHPNVTITLMLRTLHENLAYVHATQQQHLQRGSLASHQSSFSHSASTQPSVPSPPPPPPVPGATDWPHRQQSDRPLLVGVSSQSQLVLVVTRRRLLSPSDIVLQRARLSPLLETEVRRLAAWGVTGAEEREEEGNDIVLAFRPATMSHRSQPDPRSGERTLKTVQFYEVARDGNGAEHVVHKVLRVPRPLAAPMSGLSYFWRPPAQCNQPAGHEGSPPALGNNFSKIGTDSTPASSTSTSSLAVLRRTPPPPAEPTFVTATDELTPAQPRPGTRAGTTVGQAPCLRYAFSQISIPFHVCSVHENEVHAPRPTASTAHRRQSADPDAGSAAGYMNDDNDEDEDKDDDNDSCAKVSDRPQSPSGSDREVAAAARDRWRDVIALPLCLVFEDSASHVRGSGRPTSVTVASAREEVRALCVPFPHVGALGHYVLCD